MAAEPLYIPLHRLAARDPTRPQNAFVLAEARLGARDGAGASLAPERSGIGRRLGVSGLINAAADVRCETDTATPGRSAT